MNVIYWVAIFIIEVLKLELLLVKLCGCEQRKKKTPMISVFLLTLVIIVTIELLGWYDEGLTYVVGSAAMIAMILNLKNKKRIFIVLMGYIAICVIDIILAGMYALLARVNTDVLSDSQILSVVINSFSIILFIILYVIKLFKKTNKKYSTFSWLNKKYLVIIFLGLIGTGFYIAPVQIIGLMEYNNKIKLFTVLGLSLSGIAFIVLSVSLMILNNNKKYYEECYRMNQILLQQQQEYYSMLIEKETDTKKFRHDIKNHIYCISQLLELDKRQEALQYIIHMQEKVERLSILINTGNEIVNIIINDIFGKVTRTNISLQWKGMLPEKLKINNMDLCIIFSNLMKNAVEATEKVKETRELVVQVDVKYSDDSLFIQMKNPIAERIIIVNNRLESLKSDLSKHGFGSLNIENVVDQYGGKITYTSSDDIFAAEIIFHNVIM